MTQKLDPGKSIGYQVRLAHRALDRLLSARLAEHGLKTGYWYYLRVLWSEEGVTQKHLSDRINVKENTTVAMILGMEKDGLVVRERHATDRRKMNVFLTEKGRDLQRRLLPVANEINQMARQEIPAEDLKICLRVLDQVQKNLMA
jgi:DNA-binding MarR family transcriptional regulator